MKGSKKGISVLLVAVIVLSVFAIGIIPANALTPTYTVSSAYASSVYYSRLCAVELNGTQRENILKVAWSQKDYHEGDSTKDLGGTSSGSSDYTEFGYWYGTQVLKNSSGFYDQWCAMFVSWCARQAGIPTSVLKNSTAAGHAPKYFDIEYHAGGTQGKDWSASCQTYGKWGGNNYTPKPGDLFFESDWSHVGLVYSVNETNRTFSSIEGNWNKQVTTYTRSISSCYFGVPDYEDTTPPYADLGDEFYAVIKNKDCKKPIEVNEDEHVYLEEANQSASQKWKLVKQDSGAYVIYSCKTGNVLEFTNGETWVCNPITAHDVFWGGEGRALYQQWYLIPYEDGFIFQSLHHLDDEWVMDLYGAYSDPGTTIQINKRNDSPAQIWLVDSSDDVQLKAPTLTVNPGTDSTKTTFTWNSVNGSTRYDVKIWRNRVDHSVSAYHIEWGASSGYSVQLPPGTYEAYVTANDYYQCVGSQDIKFTVQGNTPANTPVDLGDDFCAVILSNSIWKPIGNDYETDHFVRLQTGEHEKNSAHQLWRFQRQSDGSYAIRSVQDAHCLEFYSGDDGPSENDPVSSHNTWWNGACQKWWIYSCSNGGYFFESCHYDSVGWYMTLEDNNPADGTPIIMCGLTGHDNQIWGIYRQSEVQLKAPTLTVDAATESETTQFSWDHVFGAKDFQVKIWKDQYDETKTPDYTDTVTSTSSSIQLPAGTYAASVTASNYWESFTSPIKKFTVSKNAYVVTLDADGGTCGIPAVTAYYDEPYGVLPVPTRDGFTFDGWFLSDGTLVTESTVCVTADDHTLTARWTAIETPAAVAPKADSGAVVDRERGFVYGLQFGVNAETLASQYLDVADGVCMEIDAVGAIGTGTVVRILDDATGDEIESFTVVLFGDLNGDGIFNSSDVTAMRSMSAQLLVYPDDSAFLFAADVNHDDLVNSSDLTLIRSAAAQIGNIRQSV